MMSRVFKILALTVALMVMVSASVLAASVTIDNKAEIPASVLQAEGSITIDATIDSGAGKQVTMIAYVDGETPAEGNIIGIDQLESGTDGAITFTIGIDGTTPVGTYVVKVGGEDVSGTLDSATFVIAAATPDDTGVISGTVTFAGTTQATVSLYADGATEPTATTTTVDGAFSFTELAAGTYKVIATKALHTKYTIEAIPVTDAEVAVGEMALYGGDLDGDGKIIIDDYSLLGGNFGVTGAGAAVADIDESGSVIIDDYSLLGGYFGKTDTVIQFTAAN